MNHNILSLDQSITSTGLCVFKQNGDLLHFECIKTDKSKTDPERISMIGLRIIKIYQDYSCGYVICEGLAFSAMGDATRKLASLMGVIENKFLESYGYKEIPKVTPTSLKKFATGSGKAKKKEMMDSLPKPIYDKFYEAGYKRTTGLADLADAYYLGRYFLESDDMKRMLISLKQVDQLTDLNNI